MVAANDWRAEVGKRPLAYSLGALGFGLLVGCALADANKRPRANGNRRAVAKAPAVKSESTAAVKESAAADPLRQELENLRHRLIDELSSITHQVLLPAIISGIREALVSDQRAARGDCAAAYHDSGQR